jgi:hypothetical protein
MDPLPTVGGSTSYGEEGKVVLRHGLNLGISREAWDAHSENKHPALANYANQGAFHVYSPVSGSGEKFADYSAPDAVALVRGCILLSQLRDAAEGETRAAVLEEIRTTDRILEEEEASLV